MKERVIDILKQFGVSESSVTEQTHFSRDLGLDSLDSVDLIMQLEQEFGIRIPDEDHHKLATMQGVLTYLEAEQAVV
ncbi:MULTISPECIES: acyl carrier protein [Spirosoma]|uniref:acyl carrier protein n=1 Tax=Spirosoma TaxID=107 RepID=UPI00095EF651|nr:MULTISPECIES: acyl carrier protein [Spirosoma]MBN8822393.1 acyl carrier protein [Spirosoma sp.]OJW73740.1 MAG: acyl carrier protein [Spirosoma sp. 48-14]